MAVDNETESAEVSLLPCGRDQDALYDHLRDGTLDEHEQSCPHCQRAARDLAVALRAARTLAGQVPQPPAGFVESVMRRVRSELRGGRHLRLPAAAPLTVVIAEHAAAAIMVTAAEMVPGVTCRGCRFPVAGDPAQVEVSIVVRASWPAGPPLLETAGQVRAAVRHIARAQLGVDLARVDIAVEDLQVMG